MLSRITLTLDEQDGKSLNFKQGSTFHGYLFNNYQLLTSVQFISPD